ncbi:MAG: insulinase family protein [Sphingobacteriales bacterium]|nr:MAG: insulinase family protein [Sphingobacteriales bacterium]
MTIPTIHNIQKIDFKLPEKITLKNNIPVFIFLDDKQNILKLDIVFNAGRWVENKQLTADAVAALCKSSTSNLSAYQLNEKIDFYGATIKASTGYNTFTVSLACLSQFLIPCLDLIMTCLNDIQFPEHELSLFQKNAKAKLAVNLEKSDFLADTLFKESVFGKQHPYGYTANNESIEAINQSGIIQYYNNFVVPNNCSVFIAGDVQTEALQYIEENLGNWVKNSALKITINSHIPIVENPPKNIRINKENSTQASIILGKRMFNKHNEDYGAFMLLNTIFGGYFGSRLMNNIREDKGLTYGIYSALQPLKFDGFWAIYTDTNLEKLDICMQEIKSEINIILENLIDDDEIKLARNYLLGRFLKRTDGAFNLLETYKSYYIEEVGIEHFGTFIETIRQADAKNLQEIAQKYLTLDTMHQIIVG